MTTDHSPTAAELLSEPPEDQGEPSGEQPSSWGPNGLAHSPTVRPSLSLSEAAQACGVHRSKIKHMHYAPEGSAFPNAWRDIGTNGPGTGPWRIPIEDLIQAGLPPNGPSPPDEQPAFISEPPNEPSLDRGELHRYAEQLRQVEADRDQFKAEADELRVWRAIAEERERSLQRLDRAMIVLGARTASPESPPHQPAPIPEPRRRRWWHR